METLKNKIHLRILSYVTLFGMALCSQSIVAMEEKPKQMTRAEKLAKIKADAEIKKAAAAAAATSAESTSTSRRSSSSSTELEKVFQEQAHDAELQAAINLSLQTPSSSSSTIQTAPTAITSVSSVSSTSTQSEQEKRRLAVEKMRESRKAYVAQKEKEADEKLAQTLHAELNTPPAKEPIKASKQLPHSTIPIHRIALLPKDVQNDGPTCGYRALYTARAIDEVVRKNLPINPQNLSTELAPYYTNKVKGCNRGLLDAENIDDFKRAHGLNIQNYFVLGFNPKTQEVFATMPRKIDVHTYEDTQLVPVNLQSLATLIKNKKLDTPIHFVCNTGGHWVLFSVVQTNGQTTLWYTDSVNAPVTDRLNKFRDYISYYLELQ
jgi:hypothetical protein